MRGYVPLTRRLKAYSMFLPLAADVSRQRHFFSFTRASIFQYFTSLQFQRSDLFPTMRTTAEASPQVYSSLNQVLRCSKERLLVRSKAMMTPRADRQQAAVMALNLSCPAVSQICVFMIILSMMKVLMASSTPMVGFDSSLKMLSVNLVRMLVFPTPESPTMINLNMKSGSICSDISIPLKFLIITEQLT